MRSVEGGKMLKQYKGVFRISMLSKTREESIIIDTIEQRITGYYILGFLFDDISLSSRNFKNRGMKYV